MEKVVEFVVFLFIVHLVVFVNQKYKETKKFERKKTRTIKRRKKTTIIMEQIFEKMTVVPDANKTCKMDRKSMLQKQALLLRYNITFKTKTKTFIDYINYHFINPHLF